MRSVSGTAGRALYGNIPFAPFELSQIIGCGQSLDAGQAAAATAVTQPFSNVKLFDSRGTTAGYIVSVPTAPTLSLVPLTALIRPVPPFGNYPQNILGQGPVLAMSNQLAAMAKAAGFSFPIFATCTGLAGAPMAQIQSPMLPFQAGIYECECAAPGPGHGQLALSLGYRSFGTLFSKLDHGETDSDNFAAANITDPAAYGGPMATLAGDYETQTRANGSAVCPYLPHVAMVFTTQNTRPASLTGRAIVTQAMQDNAAGSPDQFVNAGPKYPWMVFQVDDFHYSNYDGIGEKEGQFGFAYLTEHRQAHQLGIAPDPTAWTPCQLLTAERAGTTVTCHLHVPVPPLAFDTTTVSQPHTSGQWSMWAAGKGAEAWDNEVSVTGATDATPIEIATAGVHGLSEGDVCAQEGILGNTAANGVFFAHVVDTTHYTLFSDPGLTTPVAGSGAYTIGGIAFQPIAITAAALSGSDLVLTLARLPTSAQMIVAYAEHLDSAYGGTTNPPRRGNVRDSDPFVGLTAITPQEMYCNWLCPFLVTIP